MSDFSLTLVLQIKTSKIINDMAKIQQKSEKNHRFLWNIFRFGQIRLYSDTEGLSRCVPLGVKR